MKKNLTELVFIIDRSGSMSGLEADTVGGFNSLIEKQKNEEGECLVSAVLFNHMSEVIYDRKSLNDITVMSRKDYIPCGSTALIDATAEAIRHIGLVHKYARKEDVPEHTLFVILTDGMENASTKYSRRELKEMISRQQEKYRWEFIFIGANIDAITTAEDYGIIRENAVNYHADHIGTKVVYDAVSCAVTECRNGTLRESSEWREEADCDFGKR